ncbi:MAG: diacylglycerol kinase [Novosphingobium sp.]|nr:diacylglycerol kinase [Novosphingobium sp.]
MAKNNLIWLVYNRASGSNDEASLAALEDALHQAGMTIAQRTCFPEEPAPVAEDLMGEDIGTVCVFAGDGTIHTVVTGLFGWPGRVLVLPGGTMNLLSHQLHGEATPVEIVARLAGGGGRTTRPPILEGRYGYALTGALAGPGTEWNNAREAMRHSAIGELVSSAAGAASQSVSGDRAVLRGFEDVRAEGYAAISITPQEAGISVKGYYADDLGDYLGQLAAIVTGDFRNGPHDRLGTMPKVDIASLGGEPLGLLMDGEPHQGQASESFRIAICEVDLIATLDDA